MLKYIKPQNNITPRKKIKCIKNYKIKVLNATGATQEGISYTPGLITMKPPGYEPCESFLHECKTLKSPQ